VADAVGTRPLDTAAHKDCLIATLTPEQGQGVINQSIYNGGQHPLSVTFITQRTSVHVPAVGGKVEVGV
jgi:hypothetical protein